MEGDRNSVLAEVVRQLRQIGSANDAEDRGMTSEAEGLRAEAVAALRVVLSEHPVVGQSLPTLRAELDSGHIRGFGWSTLLDAVEPLVVRGPERPGGNALPPPAPEACAEGHLWIACFLESGALAFWACHVCGLRDRPEGLPPGERVEQDSPWVTPGPRLVARGAHAPPVSGRRWLTGDGTLLIEGPRSSTTFVGVPIPNLDEAHQYVLVGDGAILETYAPFRQQAEKHADRYVLTRFQVVGEELQSFAAYCFEDSTYEIPHALQPHQTVVLTGLRPLPATEPEDPSE